VVELLGPVSVEALVGERQLLRVPHLEPAVRMELACEGDGLRGGVDADGVRSEVGELVDRRAGAAADVHHPAAALDLQQFVGPAAQLQGVGSPVEGEQGLEEGLVHGPDPAFSC
jgi:hypothetical protein